MHLYISIRSYSHDRFMRQKSIHSQSILHAVMMHEFKGEFVQYVFYSQGWVKSMSPLLKSGQRAMTPGFDVPDYRRNQIIDGGLICGQIWGFIQWHSLSHLDSKDPLLVCSPSPSTSFSFHSLWDFTPWPDHRQSLKWIFDRTTLDDRNEVISLQMSLLDWIYYQSFTSDIARAITSKS